MNKKAIKYMLTSLVLIGCFSTISEAIITDALFYSINNLEPSSFYADNDNNQKNNEDKNKKDKHKGINLFNEENYTYLSSDQKKKLLEIKKYKDNGEKLSGNQEEELNSIIDCIIKGKLGDDNYEEFKVLTEKKNSNEKLTNEEEEQLKEYKDIIDGYKLSSKEILKQFLR